MPRNGLRGNRTDLLNPKPEPITTQPGQAYGQQTAQQQSQKIAPIGSAPVAGPSAAPPPSAQSQQGPPAPAPGIPKLPFLEPPGHGLPVTTGRPYGAGAGPEALTGLAAQWHARQQSEQGSLQDLLRGLSNTPGASSAVRLLAANAGGG